MTCWRSFSSCGSSAPVLIAQTSRYWSYCCISDLFWLWSPLCSCEGRKSKPVGNGMYSSGILEELGYLCNQCQVQVSPHATNNDSDPSQRQNQRRKQSKKMRREKCEWHPRAKFLLPGLSHCHPSGVRAVETDEQSHLLFNLPDQYPRNLTDSMLYSD